jgi:hypothetical protein
MGGRSLLFGLSVCFACLLGTEAFADKTDDFKRAADSSGCDSIPENPYYELKGRCTSIGSETHSWCDGDKGPVSCTEATGMMRVRLVNEQRNYSTLKDAASKLDSQIYSEADAEAKSKLTKDLDAAKEKLSQSEKAQSAIADELDARGKLVKQTLYNLDRCLRAREAAMAVFGDALDRMRSERSDSNNSDEIRAAAEKLLTKYLGEKEGHRTAIDNYTKAETFCKSEQP